MSNQSKENMEKEQLITPWEIKSDGAIDYKKLMKFGAKAIDGSLIKRFEKATGIRAPTWLRRGLFFSHKDLDIVLDKYEKGEQIFLYTGRGPSSESMHLGHLIPFMLTKQLQDAFNAIVVIQMSDDEKYYFKGEHDLTYYTELAYKNAKDIIAVGFNKEKTFMFANSIEFKENKMLQHNFDLMSNCVKVSDITAIFGDSIKTASQFNWPVKQSIPAYSNSFPKIFGDKHIMCLVPMAIDQDPYFRLARDFVDDVKNLGYLKPACIHSEFLPALEGMSNKLSSSNNNPTTIFLTDTLKDVENKIKKHAFSGGQETLEEHRKLGADLTVDISYQWLLYFEPDDAKLADIAHKYSSGEMLTSEIKKILITCVQNIITNHQEIRNNLTQEQVDYYFRNDKQFTSNSPMIRESIELLSDEEYNKMGCNFDRYFTETSDNDSIGDLVSELIEKSAEIAIEFCNDYKLSGNENDIQVIDDNDVDNESDSKDNTLSCE